LFYIVVHMTTPSVGDFEAAVLLSVARLADDAYGIRIRRDVSTVAKRDYSVGAVYTTLQRLEDKGLVESWLSDPIPVRGGRSRRHYRVTAPGHRALREARRRATRMWGAFGLEAETT
jgi:PadR family transcriptional regulator PadR